MSAEILSKVNGLIKEFTKSQSDVQGQIVILFPEGVPIANTWKGKIDPILVGAISAAVKLTFQSLCKNMKKGNLNRLFMNNEYGRAIIQNAGPKAILTTIIDQEADLFRIAFGMSTLTIDIEKLLKNFNYDKDLSIELDD